MLDCSKNVLSEHDTLFLKGQCSSHRYRPFWLDDHRASLECSTVLSISSCIHYSSVLLPRWYIRAARELSISPLSHSCTYQCLVFSSFYRLCRASAPYTKPFDTFFFFFLPHLLCVWNNSSFSEFLPLRCLTIHEMFPVRVLWNLPCCWLEHEHFIS